MKISLRFLFIGILLPIAATGLTLGLGSYFKVLRFHLPAGGIGNIVFLNTAYWIMVSVFFQSICEEPAFRGRDMIGMKPPDPGTRKGGCSEPRRIQ